MHLALTSLFVRRRLLAVALVLAAPAALPAVAQTGPLPAGLASADPRIRTAPRRSPLLLTRQSFASHVGRAGGSTPFLKSHHLFSTSPTALAVLTPEHPGTTGGSELDIFSPFEMSPAGVSITTASSVTAWFRGGLPAGTYLIAIDFAPGDPTTSPNVVGSVMLGYHSQSLGGCQTGWSWAQLPSWTCLIPVSTNKQPAATLKFQISGTGGPLTLLSVAMSRYGS